MGVRKGAGWGATRLAARRRLANPLFPQAQTRSSVAAARPPVSSSPRPFEHSTQGNANVYKEGKLAADAMEALIGAIYLDQGLRAAVEFVQTRMLPHLTQLYEDSLAMRPVDPVHVDDHDAYFRERLGYVDELTDAPAAPPADAPGGA